MFLIFFFFSCREDVHKLFEYWCEILPSNDSYGGQIVACYPESFKDVEIIKKIPEFAYPCQFKK